MEKTLSFVWWQKEKSEYEWMDSKNMHAHFIKNTNQKYNFEKQTNTWQDRNYNLKWKVWLS
jgi:hypothetical protein